MRHTLSAIVVVGTVVSASLWTPAARAEFPTEKFTSYAEIEIKSPVINGRLWIDTGSMESIQQIDRDGDFEYSTDEMNSARYLLSMYLQRNFLVMWRQRIQPIKVGLVEVAERSKSTRRYFRVDFHVTDLPPNQPVSIASRLLSDLTPEAKTFTRIRRDGRDELFVLGTGSYFSTDRSTPTVPPDGAYRPEAQRGRIATVGDMSVEMLYALPEGALYLYLLEADQHTPLAVGDKSLSISIQPGKEGNYMPINLAARPLTCDKADRCSRFTAGIPQFKAQSIFNADFRIGTGADAKRVIFEFPAVTIPPAGAADKPIQRRGCPNLCCGVDFPANGPATCPRCKARLIDLDGEVVPGYGVIGAHGGTLIPYAPNASFEELVTPDNEFRLYLANGELAEVPIGKLTGSIFCSTDERFQQTVVEVVLHKGEGGEFLTAKIPDTTPIPVHVRWVYNFHNGAEPAQVDFFFEQPVPLDRPTTSQPTTSQPAAAGLSANPNRVTSKPSQASLSQP